MIVKYIDLVYPFDAVFDLKGDNLKGDKWHSLPWQAFYIYSD